MTSLDSLNSSERIKAVIWLYDHVEWNWASWDNFLAMAEQKQAQILKLT